VDASTASLITSTALAQNVDPNLALAVANAESGGNQYTSSGNLVTSSTGAVGVFQLKSRGPEAGVRSTLASNSFLLMAISAGSSIAQAAPRS
jgi:hypothetical protein